MTVDPESMTVDPESMTVDSESMTVDSESMTVDSESMTVDSESMTVDSESNSPLTSIAYSTSAAIALRSLSTPTISLSGGTDVKHNLAHEP